MDTILYILAVYTASNLPSAAVTERYGVGNPYRQPNLPSPQNNYNNIPPTYEQSNPNIYNNRPAVPQQPSYGGRPQQQPSYFGNVPYQQNLGGQVNYGQTQPQSGPGQNFGQTGYHEFDLDLLKESARSKIGNMMISPASVKALLMMLAEGTEGESRNELLNKLRISSIEEARNRWQRYYNNLRDLTNTVELKNANGIFISNSYRINGTYKSNIENYYSGSIQSVDFRAAASSANTVNRFVNSATNGYIPQLVQPGNFDAQAVMILVNALYFKGNWATKFMSLPKKVKFEVNGQYIDTDMMDVETDLNYTYDPVLKCHAVDVPYADNKYSMLFLLPVNHVDEVINNLRSESIDNLLRNMEPNEVNIHMPKFDIDYTDDLTPILQTLGIHRIFGKDANLVNIVENNQRNIPHVNSIIHKTKLQVNEEGSTAAAGSGAMVVPLMGSSSIRLIFNKPFLFFIKNVESRAILFAGRLSDPTKKNQNPQSRIPVNQKRQSVEELHAISNPNPAPVLNRYHGEQQGYNIDIGLQNNIQMPISTQEYFRTETKSQQTVQKYNDRIYFDPTS